jgi:hypothetical protein
LTVSIILIAENNVINLLGQKRHLSVQDIRTLTFPEGDYVQASIDGYFDNLNLLDYEKNGLGLREAKAISIKPFYFHAISHSGRTWP